MDGRGDEIEVLTELWLAEEAGADERERLATLLRADPDARRRFGEQVRLHKALWLVSVGERVGGRAMCERVAYLVEAQRSGAAGAVASRVRRLSPDRGGRPPRRARRSGLLRGALACAAIVVAALAWWALPERPDGPATARATVAAGTVVAGGRAFSPDATLPDGTTWSCPAGSAVRLADGSRLEARAPSLVRLERDGTLRLDSGWLVARVAPRPPDAAPWRLATERLEVTVLGTVIDARAHPGGGRVEVIEGRASVRSASGGAPAPLARGEWVRALPGGAWRLGSSAHPVLAVLRGRRGPQDLYRDVLRRLEETGARLVPVDALDEVEPSAVDALLILDSIDSANHRDPTLADLPLPVLCCETWLLRTLGMQPADAALDVWFGLANGIGGDVRIVDGAHPLAAGLRGDVRLFSQQAGITWARAAAPGVRTIAHLPGRPEHGVVLVAEAGAELPGGPAPERRVAFTAMRQDAVTGDRLTADWWRLFQAAAAYLVD